MLLRMARRTLRGDRAVAATLAALLTLSVLLACAGAALITRLAGAGETLVQQADAPHLAQMHSGALDPATVDDFAASRPEVAAHRVTPLLGLDGAQLAFDGRSQEHSVQQNSLMVPGDERDLLLDLDGDPLNEVAPGTIHLPVMYRIEDSLEVGDVVTITAPDGFRHDLTVAGFVRDSIMNTAIASSKRLAVSEEDFTQVAARTGSLEHLIGFWVHDPTTEIPVLRNAYQEGGMPTAGPMLDRSGFLLFTVISEGLVAAVVLLGAAMVLVVGLLCLRLALRTALQRDRREIAVMTAIGIPARDIRRVYLLVYGAVAVSAGAAGLLGGVLLEPVMSSPLREYVGELDGDGVILVPALVAAGLVLAVLGIVSGLLRRTARGSALDALRPPAARRASASGRLRLHRSPLPAGVTQGLMALRRRGGGTVLLVTVFAVCSFLVIVPISAATTLAAPSFASQVGLGGVDLRVGIQHTGAGSEELHRAALASTSADPRVDQRIGRVTTRHLVDTAEGTTVALPVENGDHETLPVTYAEGRAPRAEDEIALSLLALIETGAVVGEELPVAVGEEGRLLTVVGAYQDITHGGITAKAQLPTDGEQIMWSAVEIALAPGTDAEATAEDLAAALPGARIEQMDVVHDQQIGPIAERMAATAMIAVLSAIGLAALFAVMISRLWLAADAEEIAIQRALGAGIGDLRTPYLTRLLAALALGVPLGVLAALTIGQGLFNMVLEVMFGGLAHLFQGASRIDLVTSPLLAGVGLPLVLALAVVAAALLATLPLRAASVRTTLTSG
ncbi:FtsX-like permease family protein [Brachybacterium sp. YJGR34]|uniref:FtsX-like permease family protein n=1 Tax=Brachybacterium sp. YJGR34 TaxID=2059911 RepID=UPI000E0C66F5|nr:FtsX-like permease family protein [Brachybacterium sp. YJGR34]